MTNPVSRRQVVGRTRGAAALIARVEALARAGGHACPSRDHWIVIAAERQLIVKTLFPGIDLEGLRTAARAALDAGGNGTPLTADAVEARAVELASSRGCSSVHELDLVWAILRHAGYADATGHDAAEPMEASPPGAPVPPAPRETAPPAAARPAAQSAAPPSTAPRAPATAPPAAPAAGDPPAADPSGRPARRRTQGHDAAAARNRPRPTPMLDRCGIDLTALATSGSLAQVVGREDEIQQVIETLCRPTKANPLLVGEPGVGKSALVEGLAQRIAAGTVPAVLLGRRVVAVQMAQVVAEAGHYGGLEQRLDAIIGEARAIRAILFFDEGHAMIGAGGREGTADVASYLKPVLARGDLSVISATTDDEYRRCIAPNAAFERRFVVIRVAEPTLAAVREILRTVRAASEAGSGIVVDDAALEQVLALASVRFPHRRQPDKSKDLLEQAIAQSLARGETAVSREDVDAAADRLAGAPAAGGERLAELAEALVTRSLVGSADATALIDRIGIGLAGLTLRPERPGRCSWRWVTTQPPRIVTSPRRSPSTCSVDATGWSPSISLPSPSPPSSAACWARRRATSATGRGCQFTRSPNGRTASCASPAWSPVTRSRGSSSRRRCATGMSRTGQVDAWC